MGFLQDTHIYTQTHTLKQDAYEQTVTEECKTHKRGKQQKSNKLHRVWCCHSERIHTHTHKHTWEGIRGYWVSHLLPLFLSVRRVCLLYSKIERVWDREPDHETDWQFVWPREEKSVNERRNHRERGGGCTNSGVCGSFSWEKECSEEFF